MFLETITAVSITLASYHSDTSVKYQQINPGVLVESGRWAAGAYYNSYKKTAAVISYNYPLYTSAPLTVSASVGVASGYSTPVVGALTAIIYDNIVVGVVPVWNSTHGPIFGLSYRIPLK